MPGEQTHTDPEKERLNRLELPCGHVPLFVFSTPDVDPPVSVLLKPITTNDPRTLRGIVAALQDAIRYLEEKSDSEHPTGHEQRGRQASDLADIRATLAEFDERLRILEAFGAGATKLFDAIFDEWGGEAEAEAGPPPEEREEDRPFYCPYCDRRHFASVCPDCGRDQLPL